MNTALYWPYDEVTVQHGRIENEFVVESPWLTTTAVLELPGVPRAKALAEKYSDGVIGASDVADINWFFRALTKFPLCYQLPRQIWEENLDNHFVDEEPLPELHGPAEWKWDSAGAITFATTEDGVDPVALFSVARRYHLISAIEDNRTQQLYNDVKARVGDREWFKKACTLMVRQNHYVTQRCESALRPALQRAQRAADKVQAFMTEERGHDRLLASSLEALGVDAEAVPVTQVSERLMNLLEFSAKRNFLAFAIAIDMFEKSSYQENDPLAQVLEFGGYAQAAKPINRHHNINDAGEHENVSTGFLAKMGPVTPEYATEALRIAEATAYNMNRMADGVRQRLSW